MFDCLLTLMMFLGFTVNVTGNLTFIMVNDECSDRIGHLLARGEENEWTRVE